MKIFLVIFIFIFNSWCLAQNDDRHYFDFWEGRWFQEINGVVDTTKTRFDVIRGIHPYSFEERWTMSFDTSYMNARGIRVWDDSNKVWSYIWMSERGHFQIWEGRKVNSDWYIYRNFNINGDKYLSRQAWLPKTDERLERVSEKSYDNGKTWILRFREYYKKIKK
ncbi:hypothetical protein L6Q79_16010 [bacterium]|nr:hypothetical protein [bacterium]